MGRGQIAPHAERSKENAPHLRSRGYSSFSSPVASAGGVRRRCLPSSLPRAQPPLPSSPHPLGAAAVRGAGLVLSARGPEGRARGQRRSLRIPLLHAPGALPSPSAVPGPAMGNVPSAVKHCLSYQQLLREHLWIGDSVAGALDPAQVLPRGPGCPHPFAHCQLISVPVM